LVGAATWTWEEQRGLDGSGRPERGAHLIQHLLLPGPHLLAPRQQFEAIGDLVTNHPWQ